MKSATIEPEIIDNRGPWRANATDMERMKFLAKMMDSAVEIPGLKVRFGLDAILGLIPGFGDFATSLISLYILQEAHRRGVSRMTLARMGSNIMVDWLVGSIPVLGDVFDVYWKSNVKNVALLQQHEANPPSPLRKSAGDKIFLAIIIGILLLVLVGSLTISYLLVSSVLRLLFHAG